MIETLIVKTQYAKEEKKINLAKFQQKGCHSKKTILAFKKFHAF